MEGLLDPPGSFQNIVAGTNTASGSADGEVSGMCTDLSRFYTFVNGEFVEFYPENKVVEKFFLATEELHRLGGGKWKDFDFTPNA